MPFPRGDRMTRERSALTAVLLGQTGRPRGEPPSAGELDAWAAKQLSGDRMAEVESHIAHDPAVFASAMAALRRRTEGREEAGWRSRFGAPWPALAGLAAAAALVAVAILRDPTGDGLAPSGGVRTPPVLRGGADDPADWRLVAFRAGYLRTQAADAAGEAEQRPEAYGCVDEACADQVEHLVRFGEAVAQTRAACAAGLTAERRAALAAELIEIEAAMTGRLELLPWRGYARALATDLAAGDDLACDRAQALHDQLIRD